jgi:hypothetical protein
VRHEWRRFIFGGESLISSTPLTQDQVISDQKGSGKQNSDQNPTYDMTHSEQGYTTGYDVTNIDDMITPGNGSEVEADLELRNTEIRVSQPSK